MPRDILSDSLAVLRIVEHEDEENWPLDEKPCKQKQCNILLKSHQPFPKDDCTGYYNYAHGETTTNRQNDPVYQYKTSSLPAASSMNQSWDEIVCSALRLTPEDIANQLTLLDLPCFKSIRPEELTTCGWNKLNKQTVAPNIVAFTKRFNRVSFWTVQEILNGQSAKNRAEILTHFIKVAKKLHELNNLHSLFAVVSALQSASIYRLTKTWAAISKKDKQQFDKLAELFGEKDNWTALREYMRSISLPCVPYLGIFLTDLTYIDIAHPAGSPHRTAKMAVVLKTLHRYQTSDYDILPLQHVAVYLNSVRYIEELQKFLEEDHFKLSLKLEPQSPIGSCTGSKESVKEVLPPVCSHVSVSPSKIGSGSLRLQGTSHQGRFIPTHRKCRSLGSNSRDRIDNCMEVLKASHHHGYTQLHLDPAQAKCHPYSASWELFSSTSRGLFPANHCALCGEEKRMIIFRRIFGKNQPDDKNEKTPAGSVNLLDDTLLESPGSVAGDKLSQTLPHNVLVKPEQLPCDFQGFVRRKTMLKDGRKISLSSWQRYWMQMSADVLIFYGSKSFKGSARGDFRTERCKVLALDGWSAKWDADAPDAFQLLNRHVGTLYKFKTTSESMAKQWVTKIEDVAIKVMKPLPANLMTFE